MTQMTQISKFRYTELYTWETENKLSFSAHMVYCQKLTKVLYCKGSLDKFHRTSLTQIMFSGCNALIIEINNENIALNSLHVWKLNLTLLKQLDR